MNTNNTTYYINREEDFLEIEKKSKALASNLRIKILKQLFEKPLSISEIATMNNLDMTNAIFHLKILENAGYVLLKEITRNKRNVKFCYLNFTKFSIDFDNKIQTNQINKFVQSMPIGMYVDAEFYDFARMANNIERLAFNPNNVFGNFRFNVGLIWTNGGKLTYAFNNDFCLTNVVKELVFSLEICSEAPGYRHDWKSDITFSVNDKEILTYTAPGDYGDKPGKLNPSWWSLGSTQYGDLIKIKIDNVGVYLNDILVNSIYTLNDLNLKRNNKILFKLETKKDAVNYNGFNLFGKTWGNYEQDIVLEALLEPKISE